ncbi:hypothetical protein FRC09_007212, partial [Ceratobasidium sp. 395]
MVQTPNGQWWAVFLGTRPQNPTNSSGRPQLGRETFLAPVQWTKDGWYTINGGKDISFSMPGLYDLETPAVWTDKFIGTFSDKNYYTVRTPYKPFHSFPKSGGLSLRGNVYTLSDRETPAAFFRKQSEISTVFSTKLTFSPTSTRHEAGVTIYLSIHYHNEVGITINPNSNKTAVFATTRSGELATAKTTYVDLPDGVHSAQLFIKAEPGQYSFGYSTGAELPKYIASVESKWLQAYLSGWQNFVGSHFGIYTTGNGLPILQTARLMASKAATGSANLRNFFGSGSQNNSNPARKKAQILISDDEDDAPPPPKKANEAKPPRSASPAPRQSRAKRKSTVLMDSDDEGSKEAPAKKATLAKSIKESTKVVTQPGGQLKPLAGMSIVFTGEFNWERERLVDATKKHGGEVLKQPSSTTSFIVVGKGVSESKLRAIEKLKLRTRTEQEFMDLIKPPAPEKAAPAPKAKVSSPKKVVPSKKRASSPVEEDEDEDEDEDDPPPKPPAKRKAAAKKRASSPAESDDQAPSKPATKKGGWNRPTGDAAFDSALAAAKAAKAAGPTAHGSKDVPDGHPNALAGLTFV